LFPEQAPTLSCWCVHPPQRKAPTKKARPSVFFRATKRAICRENATLSSANLRRGCTTRDTRAWARVVATDFVGLGIAFPRSVSHPAKRDTAVFVCHYAHRRERVANTSDRAFDQRLSRCSRVTMVREEELRTHNNATHERSGAARNIKLARFSVGLFAPVSPNEPAHATEGL